MTPTEPRPWLEAIHPYVPGVKAGDETGSLASNESPTGPGPAVRDAVAQAAADLHRYPDPLASELVQALASEHRVDPGQILVGNGSDELILLLALAYTAHGGTVVCADPAYRVDEISAIVANARVHKVPLHRWKHDLQAMADLEADIAYVVNPHNPTGTVHTLAALEAFVERARARLVVIDEAYIDFADPETTTTAMDLARTGQALVLRTFSKAHGLAGARVGYLVGPADVMEVLRKIRAPFSVGSLGQAAALASLRNPAGSRATVASTRERRGQLEELLHAAGHPPIPSQGNFVLVPTDDEQALVDRFTAGGLAVRPGSALGAPGTVRITVPDHAGLDRVASALLPERIGA